MKQQSLPLSIIWQRLNLPDRALLRTVLAYAKEFSAFQLQVKSVLDDKAQKGFGMAATALTLLCTLGTLLAHLLSPLPWPTLFTGLFLVTGAFFLGSAWAYYQSNRPASYQSLNVLEILNPDYLTWSGEKDMQADRRYDMGMARHFFYSGQAMAEANEKKAGVMRVGARLFLAGLFFVLLDLVLFAVGIAERQV